MNIQGHSLPPFYCAYHLPAAATDFIIGLKKLLVDMSQHWHKLHTGVIDRFHSPTKAMIQEVNHRAPWT